MQEIVKRQMEGVVSLKVPLKVDMGIGVNWFDLK
jgi:DNA polymerase-1